MTTIPRRLTLKDVQDLHAAIQWGRGLGNDWLDTAVPEDIASLALLVASAEKELRRAEIVMNDALSKSAWLST